jgi:hypothetical protein
METLFYGIPPTLYRSMWDSFPAGPVIVRDAARCFGHMES